MPLNTRLTAGELAFQLDDCEPRLVVRAPELDVPARAGTLALAPDELRARMPARADDVATAPGGEAPQVILYTSGTTGQPKGAVLPHRKTYWNTRNAELYFELAPDSVVVTPIPLFHSFGLKILSVPALYCGATVVLVDRFDPARPAGLRRAPPRHAARRGARHVPAHARGTGSRRRSSRACASRSRPARRSRPRRSRATSPPGICLKQGYGQTETSILCCLDAADAERKAGSVGRRGALRRAAHRRRGGPRGCRRRAGGGPGARADRDARLLAAGPSESAHARQDGWHRTGDLGVRDAEGFVTLVGRLKELYISGGENVYPAEVERVLGQHPDVSEVAVVGVPDERWGEAGRAYVVPAREPFDGAALLRWASERLARYKLPREVVVGGRAAAHRVGKGAEACVAQRALSLVAALALASCSLFQAPEDTDHAARARPRPRPARRDPVRRLAAVGRRITLLRDVSSQAAARTTRCTVSATLVPPYTEGGRRTLTLRGMWQTAPYLWDDSAQTVAGAVDRMLAVEMLGGKPRGARPRGARGLPALDPGLRPRADPAGRRDRRAGDARLAAGLRGLRAGLRRVPRAAAVHAAATRGRGHGRVGRAHAARRLGLRSVRSRRPLARSRDRDPLHGRSPGGATSSADELAQLLAYLQLL